MKNPILNSSPSWRRAFILLASLSLLGTASTANADRAQIYRQWTVSDGTIRDGWLAFDWHIVYRWPKNAKNPHWVAGSLRAKCVFIGMSETGGKGTSWVSGNYRYVEATAGLRARVLYPLKYAQLPFGFDYQRNGFANDLGVEYSP